MQDAIKAILAILEDGTPELQIAAAQILGELRPTDAKVVEALAERLEGAEQYLSRHILTALSQIPTKPAVAALVARVADPSSDGDLVAHLLKGAGDSVTPQLCEVFDDADPETKVRILDILADRHSAESAPVLESALADPELTVRAADAFIGVLDTIPAAKLRYIKDRLKKAVTKDEDAPVEVRGQMLRVYGAVDPKNARTLLVKFTEPSNPPALREAALRGLQGAVLTPTQSAAMLDLLSEKDLERIVGPATELLAAQTKWSEAGVAKLRKLLSSRRDHHKLFAVRAYRHVPKAEVVKTLIQHLLGSDRAMSEAAREALSHNPKAVETLIRSFSLEKDPARARLMAEPLVALGDGIPTAKRKSLLEKGCKLLATGDESGEVYLDLLLRIGGEDAAAEIVDKALRLRRARKIQEARQILLFLATGRHLDDEGQYQLALTRLLADGKPGRGDAADQPAGDATMGHFAVLVREGFPVFERITKESMVAPECLLRLGRHFAGGVGNERRFGADLLEHVAEKHGKQRAGEEARLVLRAGGV